MRLVSRTAKEKFEVLQKLLQPGQKAYLIRHYNDGPTIRIETTSLGCVTAFDNHFYPQEEITSEEQLKEEEYKII